MRSKPFDKEEKRNQIIKAATKIFIKKGFFGTTISEIAKEADIGKGTIYEYFKSKDDIIFSTFSLYINNIRKKIEKIIESKLNPKEKLEKAITLFVESMNKEADKLVKLMFDFWSIAVKEKQIGKSFLIEINNFYKQYRAMFSEILIQGIKNGYFKKYINPHQQAIIITCMLDGILTQYVMGNSCIKYQETIKSFISTIFKGIVNEQHNLLKSYK